MTIIEIMERTMFKKLIDEIVAAKSIKDLDAIEGKIGKAFDSGSINYRDHERLIDLIAKCSGGYYYRANVPHIDGTYQEA